LQAIPDTIFRFNAEGLLLDYVPGEATADILPAPSAAQISRDVGDLLPNAFGVKARNLIQLALRSGQMQRLEFEAPMENQSKYYEALCLPFGSDEALLVLRDFTAIKWHQGEDERRRIREELDQKVEKRLQANPYGLTFRELAILHLVADGAADKQIAESMGISTHTVNKHVGNILAKMSASSRTEAGVRAIREGLLA
jgi:DNA-binding CsgD family transcriptional regulator